jgi:diguanylate cyclase (GGDEF)-like protein
VFRNRPKSIQIAGRDADKSEGATMGMISVKNALTDLDRQAQELEKARRAESRCMTLWAESLGAVGEQLFPLFPEASAKVDEDWRQVHACLQPGGPREVWESTPRLVERVLHNYANDARRTQREDLDAVKSILEVMAGAAISVRARTDSYGSTFQGVCESLGRLVQLENPDELRKQLGQEARQLRESVAQMVRESEEALSAMESDLQQFRRRLAAAEAAASTDPLTGLANRRELERQLEVRIEEMRPFCVLLFDLDGFKSINDRFGHECGDQALRKFGAVLNEQVRPGDVVARWGGDEFIVILDCAIKDALRRSQQISEKLARRYEIDWNGKKVQIALKASSGVVEYCCGETSEALFRRADQAMYQMKQKNVPAGKD